MEIVIKISQFLLSLSLLIVLHELGHFIPAKLFKTKVDKFFLFFDAGFSIFSTKKIKGKRRYKFFSKNQPDTTIEVINGQKVEVPIDINSLPDEDWRKYPENTKFGIGWIPLGGYVKIAGMIDESMDTEQMKKEPQPWEFRSKPAWQRLIIMLGGVFVNFVLAFLIYIGITYAYGDLDIKNSELKDGIWVNNPVLEQAGLQTGDKIISINGKNIESFYEIPEKVLLGNQIVVNRNQVETTINLPDNLIGQIVDENKKSLVLLRIPIIVSGVPEDSKNKDVLQVKDMIVEINGQTVPYVDELPLVLETMKGQTVPAKIIRNEKEEIIQLVVNEEGKLGFAYPPAIATSDIEKLGLYHVTRVKHGFTESIPVGIDKGFERLGSYWDQLKKIFNPKTEAYKGVGGFYSIFNIFPDVWSWEAFWNITAILSIMLGVMNLLPIPALDGGHVMFLLYEMITKRKPSEKFMEKAQMAGFFILIALLLFANGNDIFRAFK